MLTSLHMRVIPCYWRSGKRLEFSCIEYSRKGAQDTRMPGKLCREAGVEEDFDKMSGKGHWQITTPAECQGWQIG